VAEAISCACRQLTPYLIRHERDSFGCYFGERLDSAALSGRARIDGPQFSNWGHPGAVGVSQLLVGKRIDRAAFFVPTAKEVAVGYGC